METGRKCDPMGGGVEARAALWRCGEGERHRRGIGWNLGCAWALTGRGELTEALDGVGEWPKRAGDGDPGRHGEVLHGGDAWVK